MAVPAWSTQQLAEFVAAVSTARSEAVAAQTAVERAAEALDADVAAIVAGGKVIASVGYVEGTAPVADLEAVEPGAGGFFLNVPGVGRCTATAVALEHPPDSSLVVARPGSEGLSRDESGLLRAMGRVASLTMRTQRLLDEERAARAELQRLAGEQAALGRVATLVARAAAPAEVFAGVAEEVGHVFPAADVTMVGRYDSGEAIEFVGGWNRNGETSWVGTRVILGGRNVATLVHERQQPARVDYLADDDAAATAVARKTGARSAAGVPIHVAGRLWGVMTVGSSETGRLPPGIEHRLAEFTDLIATAIANAEASEELARVAQEQAALRRVATLVAQSAPPRAVFAAVAEEVGRLVGMEPAYLNRFDPRGVLTVMAAWPPLDRELPFTIRPPTDGPSASAIVRETGRPARLVPDSDLGDGRIIRKAGYRSVVAAPITVEGRIWGMLGVASASEEAPPLGTEARLAGFAQLVATAISNAEAQAELAASRARIIAAADETRRRIERDLHDGAQQRLISLLLQVRTAQAAVPPEMEELAAELDRVAAVADTALEELHEFARGIHPAVLTRSGLGAALKSLARSCPVPVDLDVRVGGRLAEPIEAGAYYVASEALTNAAKHANASEITVGVEEIGGLLRVVVSDDGVGGADFGRGSGLVGLKDRVEALGGRITLFSERGAGTSIQVDLPLNGPREPASWS